MTAEHPEVAVATRGVDPNQLVLYGARRSRRTPNYIGLVRQSGSKQDEILIDVGTREVIPE